MPLSERVLLDPRSWDRLDHLAHDAGPVPGLAGIVAIGAGANHSLAVLGDGRLFTWGLNSSGQLGDNTTTLRRSPVHVTTLAGVSAAAGGSSYPVVLLASGAVYAMGANTVGQVGDGTTTQRKTPVPVVGLSSIVQVAARDDHTVALAADGAVYTWGRNTNGQLGDNTTTFRSTALSIGSSGTTWILPGPTITPASGSYSSAQSVTISSSIPGAFLHYTLDGTEPTLASLLYSAPFSVSNTVTVRARAFKDGWTDSPDTVRTYTFPGTDSLPPTITAPVAPPRTAPAGSPAPRQ